MSPARETDAPLALLSVFDKRGIVELGRGLCELGYGLLSTGGTLQQLRQAQVPAREVAEYTGSPEMLDGRVKTLHPRIHGGLLGRRDVAAHRDAMATHGIAAIDLVAVNLYPFAATLQRAGATPDEIVEMIDIGGPAMLRSAAKNHAWVTVVVDPDDYDRVLAALRRGGSPADLAVLRAELAAKAFRHTASYDATIAGYLGRRDAAALPERLVLAGEKLCDLRYGENPHQAAAVYAEVGAGSVRSLATARQLNGKELSYNNYLDLDAAWALVREFTEACCAVIKHTNPCGCATASNLVTAFDRALAGDPLSAFGGIVACNAPVDGATAASMTREGTFLEAIVAPEFDDEAVATLRAAKWGKSVRLLAAGAAVAAPRRRTVRPIDGGFLLQDEDPVIGEDLGWRLVTQRAPTREEAAALQFGVRVVKHVKSNAIVLARGTELVGVGAGQMSRVDAAEHAVRKAGERSRGACLASDAFFPFADGLQVAAGAGVTACIQPGGSKNDMSVIAAADAAGMAMVLTGRRHFRH